MHIDLAYQSLLDDILNNGQRHSNRTGVDTLSVWGRMVRADLSNGFPLLTTKRVHFKSVAVELLWLLSGSQNIEFMRENGVTIWEEWADDLGNLGPIYGKQWREWEGIGWEHDQISNLVETLKKDPFSRRMVVSAWNVDDIPMMKLPPCHYAFQCGVADDGINGLKLNMLVNMRSVDVFLGLPFNIASYALLTHMLAEVCGLGVGELVMSLADTHLYVNHLDQSKEQLTREPFNLPRLKFARPVKSIDDFTYEDIQLLDYQHHAAIKADVAV